MASGTNIGSLYWSTGIDSTGLRRDSKKASSALSGLFNPAILGATALAGAILKAGNAALTFSRDFETAFAEVQTISQTARDNADAMRDSLLELTTRIPVQAVDATKALYQIVSAGFDGAEAMAVLEASAKAAVAGVSTTAVAADTLTTIVNAYGLSASEVTGVSDALFKTVELGKTTLSELGSSFSQVAGLGAAYKIELNDILAATAQLTSQGASTSEAITRIRGGIVALSKEFGPAVFEGRNLAEAFQFARDEADKTGKGYEEFFGRVEAVVGILGLTGDQLDNYTDKLSKVNTATGSTDLALQQINKTFDSQYQLLKNNITVAFSGFGDLLKNTLTPIIKTFNEQFETGSDRIESSTKKSFESIIAESKKLATAEEQRAFIISQIIKLQKESENEQQSINRVQKEQPGILRRNLELINQTIGLGDKFTSGIDNEKILQFSKEQQSAILNSKKLLEDYFKTIQNESQKLEGLGSKELVQLKKDLQESLSLGFGNDVNENIKKQIDAVTEQIKKVKAVDVPIKITTKESIESEIKELKERIQKASAQNAAILNVKLETKERELDDFIDKITRSVSAGPKIKLISIPKLGDDFKQIKKDVKETTLEVNKLNKKIKETGGTTDDAVNKSEKELNIFLDNLLEIETGFRGISRAIYEIDPGLSKATNTLADFASLVGNISAGNIGGAITSASSILGLIINMNRPDTYENKLAKTLDKINISLDRQSALLANLSGDDYYEISAIQVAEYNKSIDKLYANLKGLKFVTKEAFESYQIDPRIGQYLDPAEFIDTTNWDSTDFVKAMSEGMGFIGKGDSSANDLLNKIIEIEGELSGFDDESLVEKIGVSVSDLSDSLAEAFFNGEIAAESWGKTVDGIIKDIIIKQLTSDLLTGQIKKATDFFSEAARDGLTPDEADAFKNEVERIASTTAPAFEAARKALEDIGFDFIGTDSTDTGIAGAIKREITEETAGLLLGRTIAIQVDLKEIQDLNINQNEILLESSGYLQQIEVNTRNLSLMPELVSEVQSMNVNLKNNL